MSLVRIQKPTGGTAPVRLETILNKPGVLEKLNEILDNSPGGKNSPEISDQSNAAPPLHPGTR